MVIIIMAPWRGESPGALDASPPAQPHILKIGQIISHSQNRACSSKAEHSCLGAQRRRRGGGGAAEQSCADVWVECIAHEREEDYRCLRPAYVE
jgi:hypothetical protein